MQGFWVGYGGISVSANDSHLVGSHLAFAHGWQTWKDTGSMRLCTHSHPRLWEPGSLGSCLVPSLVVGCVVIIAESSESISVPAGDALLP